MWPKYGFMECLFFFNIYCIVSTVQFSEYQAFSVSKGNWKPFPPPPPKKIKSVTVPLMIRENIFPFHVFHCIAILVFFSSFVIGFQMLWRTLQIWMWYFMFMGHILGGSFTFIVFKYLIVVSFFGCRKCNLHKGFYGKVLLTSFFPLLSLACSHFQCHFIWFGCCRDFHFVFRVSEAEMLLFMVKLRANATFI